jgi:hypothetical protein
MAGQLWRIMTIHKISWHSKYLRVAIISCSNKSFLFLFFPYTTFYILSFILWFALIILIPGINLDNFSTLSSYPSSCSCPGFNLLALHLISTIIPLSLNYTKLSVHNLLTYVTPVTCYHNLLHLLPSPTLSWKALSQ